MNSHRMQGCVSVWQRVSLHKGPYHFTTLTLTRLLLEELWMELCSPGEGG